MLLVLNARTEILGGAGHAECSVIIRTRERELQVSDGPPCTAPYVEYQPA
jgi:hypothetical protein